VTGLEVVAGGASLPPTVTPSGAVQIQDDLGKFWRSSRGPDFAQGWHEVRRRDGCPVYFSTPEARALHETHTLAGARTYLVAEQMLEVARHAAKSLPDESLLETDLPTPNGFLVFERAFVLPDIRGNNVTLLAFAWRRFIQDGRPMLFWSYYSEVEDPRDDYSDGVTKAARGRWPSRAILLAEDVEEFGVASVSAEEIVSHNVHAAGVEVVRLTLEAMHKLPRALFALLNSNVADVAEERTDRATRRRLERGKSPLAGSVQVIRLRRPHGEVAGPDGGPVEWSHRWLVSGHWRNAWRPSVEAHRLVWIAPFVKGPADRPLILRRKVHVLDR
jgi:hypothetical protein